MLINEWLVSMEGRHAEGHIQAFADDGAMLFVGIDLGTVRGSAQRAVTRTARWAESKGLGINPAKMEGMLLTKKRGRNMEPLEIGGRPIPMKDDVKILGIRIDRNLTWKNHCQEKMRTCSALLVTCRRAVGNTWGLKPKVAQWIYTALVRPMLTYGAMIWVPAILRQERVKELQKVQRLGCRLITAAFHTTPTMAMEMALGIEPIDIFVAMAAVNAAMRLKQEETWRRRVRWSHGDSHGKLCETILRGISGMNKATDGMRPCSIERKEYRVIIQDRERAIREEGETVDAKMFTDGSRMGNLTGMGFSIRIPGEEEIEASIPLGATPTVYQAEVGAIAYGAFELIERGIPKGMALTIFSDNQACLRALDGLFSGNCQGIMSTVVESEEEKYEAGETEDVIEELDVEKNVEVAEATSQYEDAVKKRRAMAQSDTTFDQFETLIQKDLVEDEDLDVKELVRQSEVAPQSQNCLEVARTILKPEVVKENGSQYIAMGKHIENVMEEEPVANLHINGDHLVSFDKMVSGGAQEGNTLLQLHFLPPLHYDTRLNVSTKECYSCVDYSLLNPTYWRPGSGKAILIASCTQEGKGLLFPLPKYPKRVLAAIRIRVPQDPQFCISRICRRKSLFQQLRLIENGKMTLEPLLCDAGILRQKASVQTATPHHHVPKPSKRSFRVSEGLCPPNTILGVDNKIYRRIYYVELSDTMAATERLSPTPAAALCPPTSLVADVQMIPLPSSPTSSMPQPSTSFMSSTPKTSKSTAHLPFRVLDTTSNQDPALVTSTPIPTKPHESPERLIIDVSLATDTTISTVADPKDVSYVPSEDAASEASSDCEKDLAVEERGWNARYVVVDRRILLQLIRSSSCQKKPNCTAKVMDIREHRKPDGASYSVRVTCDLVSGMIFLQCSVQDTVLYMEV
ncbi:unnamed protein product, partial [Cyprideis torosa]